MRWIWIILLLVFGCTPEQRFQNLIKRHPSLIGTVRTNFIDTIQVPGSRKDTTVVSHSRIDTVVLRNDRFYTRVIKHNDTINVATTVIPQTITKNITLPAKVVEKEVVPKWAYIAAGVAALAVLIIALIVIVKPSGYG